MNPDETLFKVWTTEAEKSKVYRNLYLQTTEPRSVKTPPTLKQQKTVLLHGEGLQDQTWMTQTRLWKYHLKPRL